MVHVKKASRLPRQLDLFKIRIMGNYRETLGKEMQYTLRVTANIKVE